MTAPTIEQSTHPTEAPAHKQCIHSGCVNEGAAHRHHYCRPHWAEQNTARRNGRANWARNLIQQNLDRGIGIKAIAEATNIAERTLRDLVTHRQNYLHDYTAARLAKLPHLHLEPARHPTWQAARRLQALQAAGHSVPEIAKRTGLAERAIHQICAEKYPAVYDATWQAINDDYQAHQLDPARPADPRIKRHNWPKPMDWDNIDDPQEDPTSRDKYVARRAIPVEPRHRAAAQELIDHYGSAFRAGRGAQLSATTLACVASGERQEVLNTTLQKILDHVTDLEIGAIRTLRPVD